MPKVPCGHCKATGSCSCSECRLQAGNIDRGSFLNNNVVSCVLCNGTGFQMEYSTIEESISHRKGVAKRNIRLK